MGGREGRDVEGHAAYEVGRGRGEILLLQGRGAKAVLHRAAQGERVGEIIAQRQLAAEVGPEVRIALLAHSRGSQKLLGDTRLQVGVNTCRRATLVHRVGWPESREYLRARCGRGTARQQSSAVTIGI